MKRYKGVYRGFAQTSESAIGLGECEVIITDKNVRYRAAIGSGLIEDDILLDLFVASPPRNRPEMLGLSMDDAERLKRVVVFEGPDGSPVYFFMEHARDDEPGLYIMTCLEGDGFGNIFLFNPEQQKKGIFETTLKQIEEQSGLPGSVLRLAHDDKIAKMHQ
ncbi:hypothetical protein HGA64_05715 [Candidatus Falkowbacteria bacterium]|nr:hypothetical protein [Candidatus Falkowbacteria bacterium]